MNNLYNNSFAMGNGMLEFNFLDEDDIKDFVDYYLLEKNSLKTKLLKLKNYKYKLSNYIDFLLKKYYCVDVKHNNTINFLLTKNNIKNLLYLINKYTEIYNDNLNEIHMTTNKINNITLIINKFYK